MRPQGARIGPALRRLLHPRHAGMVAGGQMRGEAGGRIGNRVGRRDGDGVEAGRARGLLQFGAQRGAAQKSRSA
jgi:hypothetical protein